MSVSRGNRVFKTNSFKTNVFILFYGYYFMVIILWLKVEEYR